MPRPKLVDVGVELGRILDDAAELEGDADAAVVDERAVDRALLSCSAISVGGTPTGVAPSAATRSRTVGEAKRSRRPLKSSSVRIAFFVVCGPPGWCVNSISTLMPLCSASRYFARSSASFSTLVPISELPTMNGRLMISVSGKRPGVPPCRNQDTSA